jgi:hypothetical protein
MASTSLDKASFNASTGPIFFSLIKGSPGYGSKNRILGLSKNYLFLAFFFFFFGPQCPQPIAHLPLLCYGSNFTCAP